MIKIKQTKNGLFKLTGLNLTDLEIINTLIAHTRLGNNVYEQAAFDILEAFELFKENEEGYELDECILTVSHEYDTPTITLTSNYD